VLVTQTTRKNILRYWLLGPKDNTSELFALLQGFPDNINRNIYGDFLVAENNAGKGKAVKFDAQGKFLRVLDGLNPISHAQEFHHNL
jgi:hypothetical protein